MKKIFILSILLLSCVCVKSQSLKFSESKTEQVFALNNKKLPSNDFIERTKTQTKIDLKLPSNFTGDDDKRLSGVVLLVSGIAFTTAGILGDGETIEGDVPRQVMLGVGVGFTLIGGVITLRK